MDHAQGALDRHLRGRLRKASRRGDLRDPSARRAVVRAMRNKAPSDLPDVGAYRFWKPEAQQRALELLERRRAKPWRPFYCPNPRCDGKPHDTWDFNHARRDQRPPRWQDDWLTWVLSGGRGSGKTRTGSEMTHRVTKFTGRIILVAATGPDLRDTMVEGESGLLDTAKPDQMPEWEPSKKKLTWPNGCIAQGFSAEEPDRLRGPQSGFIWTDEPAHYPQIETVWDNMLFGLRLGTKPKVVATSTPKPTKWMKALLADPLTVNHRVSSYANLDNLADTYRRTVLDRYEGTRIGRQELHGEVLEDVEGALWNWDMFQWIDTAPELRRIVVAVDPAGTANRRSDETGIVVVGIGFDKCLYVLHDATDKYSPERWGSRANGLYEEYSADAIVPEKNYGQDMVRFVLENAGHKGARIKGVESRRGKAIRAEPIVALYEKKRVYHVGQKGELSQLEDELTTWVPGESDSPNRLDALVHGATELAKNIMPTSVSDPNKLLRERRSPTSLHLRAV